MTTELPTDVFIVLSAKQDIFLFPYELEGLLFC